MCIRDRIVKFRAFGGTGADDDLIVDGTLLADGAPAAPIIFTSDLDDSSGGDTRNDGVTTGGNGDWSSIQLHAASTNNVLNHVEVRFGGGGRAAMVVADGGSLAVSNSVLRNSSSHALLARANSVVKLENGLVVRNGDTGLRAESGSTVIATNNTFDGNLRGTSADGIGTVLVLTNNLITNNSQAGIAETNRGAVTIRFNNVFNPGAITGNYSGLALSLIHI